MSKWEGAIDGRIQLKLKPLACTFTPIVYKYLFSIPIMPVPGVYSLDGLAH